MTYRDNDAIGGMGASARPGDIRRGILAVRSSLNRALSDTEGLRDSLHHVYGGLSVEDRITERGTVIGEAFDQTLTLLGVLKGALSLCPRDRRAEFTDNHLD